LFLQFLSVSTNSQAVNVAVELESVQAVDAVAEVLAIDTRASEVKTLTAHGVTLSRYSKRAVNPQISEVQRT
jgi:hypothetical protein